MPSGHTGKQTLTSYRAGLLRLLPSAANDFGNPARHQLNEMIRFGLVYLVDGKYHRTIDGTRVLNEMDDHGHYTTKSTNIP